MKAKSLNNKYRYVAFLYISPWIIGFLWLQIYPFISSFYYAFTDLSMLKAPRFVGLANFKNILTADKNFWQSIMVTTKYVFIAVPLKLAFALFIAMLLNVKIKGISFFKTVYYLPSILGGSVGIAVLWRYLFSKEGFVNLLLSKINIEQINWLGSQYVALVTIIILTVWQFGSSMILFLAAIQQIPRELYEAAMVDGAQSVIRFFKITLPMITPILLFNIVMQMINAFQEFSAPFLITKGGPMKSTYLYGLLIYDSAFTYLKMGYASALSWVLFLIIVLITMIIFKSSAYWTFYQDGEK